MDETKLWEFARFLHPKEDHLVIRLFKEEIRSKLYNQTDKNTLFFISSLIFIIGVMLIFAIYIKMFLIWVIGVLALLLILTFMKYDRMYEDYLDDLKKAVLNRNSYHDIYQFQVLPSDDVKDSINGDDLIWRAGILYPLEDQEDRYFHNQETIDEMASKLNLNGYRPKFVEYVEKGKFPIRYSTGFKIPVLLTVNNIIYPLMELDMFVGENREYSFGYGKKDSYMRRINEHYNLPRQPDCQGRTKLWDLKTDIGYIILQSRYGYFRPHQKPKRYKK